MVRLTLNHAGMNDLLHDERIRAMLTARMTRVLAAAKATAPAETGAYRDSLHLEQVTHPSRAVVRVVAGTGHAILVESRTGVLARALDAAGGA